MQLLSILLFSLLSLSSVISQAEISQTQTGFKSIVLAGGCFWCIESDYEKLNGVIDVVSGYSGGHIKNPRYAQVSGGNSGHIEVVKVTFDPETISFANILDFFWKHVDPTRDDGQFCDRGPQYRPAIFYKNTEDKQAILKSARQIEQNKPFSEALKVEFLPEQTFYLAEEYHQDYYKKNPLRYNYYRFSCGRDARVKELWGTSDH